MRAAPAIPTDSSPSSEPSRSRKRRTAPRLPGMKRNAKRVPTAQRMRTFYRLFRRLLQWVRPVLALALCFLVGRYVWDAFHRSAMFSLKRVEMPSYSAISKKELMEFAGLRYGANLLTLNLQKTARRMARHPQVQSVQVRRELPATLVLEVKTHRPIAIAQLGDLYYIDRKGRPFARVPSASSTAKGALQKTSTVADGRPKLLLLTGFQRTDYQQDPEGTQQLFLRSLALAKLYKQRKLSRYQPLLEVQYDSILGYILRTPTGEIRMGTRDFSTRMAQLEKIYRLFWQRGVRRLRYVYLNHRRHTRRAIVKVDDAVLVQPSAPAPNKDKRNANYEH